MSVDMLLYTSKCARRKTARPRLLRRERRGMGQRILAGSRMKHGPCVVMRIGGADVGRRDQGDPRDAFRGGQERGRDVATAAPPEAIRIRAEQYGQPGPMIDSSAALLQHPASLSICADHSLIAIHRKKHVAIGTMARHGREDPP